MANQGGETKAKGEARHRVIRAGEARDEAPPASGEVRAWLQARYQDGDLSARLHAAAGYGKGGRSATMEFAIPDDDEAADLLDALAKAMAAIVERYGDDARDEARAAAGEAWAVARRNREE